MNETLIGSILPGVMYKHLLDIINEEPVRKLILNRFHDKFDYVWLTFYGDVVVAVEVEGEAVFILQEGVFRYRKYINKKDSSFIGLKEYFNKEFFVLSIISDLYEIQEDFLWKSYIDFPIYILEPLISCSDEDKSLVLFDNSLSEKYLNDLYNNLLLYYSLVKENYDYLDLIQS